MTEVLHICRYCDKPVDEDVPVHGLTGDHWECYEAARNLLEAFCGAPAPRNVQRVVRANGGLRIHVQAENSAAVLCGKVPRNGGNGKMRARGKWVPLRYTFDQFLQMRTTEGTVGCGPRACAACQQSLGKIKESS